MADKNITYVYFNRPTGVPQYLIDQTPYLVSNSGAAATANNTTNEVTLFDKQIDAGVLTDNATIRISGTHQYLNNSGSGRTLTLRLYLNNVLVASGPSGSVNSSASPRSGDLLAVIKSVSDTSQNGSLNYRLSSIVVGAVGTGSVNGNANVTVKLTAQHSNNDTTYSLDEYTITINPGLA